MASLRRGQRTEAHSRKKSRQKVQSSRGLVRSRSQAAHPSRSVDSVSMHLATGGQGIQLTALAKEQFAWLSKQLEIETDECVPWPFNRTKGGYGRTTRLFGTQFLVSRLLCELVTGPPPSQKHEAAHICGRGGFGCANWRHLKWKTPSDNRLDKRAHGTWWRGGNKLSPARVEEIRKVGRTKRQRALAREFEISQANVSLIINGKTW